MTTNESLLTGTTKDTSEKMKELESIVSKVILTGMNFYSKYDIKHIIKKDSCVDEKTVKSHIEKGGIPAKYFEDYVMAIKKATNAAPKIKKSLKQKNRLDTWKPFATVQHESMDLVYKEVNELLNIGKILTDCFLGNSVHSNYHWIAPLVSVVEGWQKRVNLEDYKNFSPLFLSRLNLSFDAFSSINYKDQIFLTHFYQAAEGERTEILAKMDAMDMCPASRITSNLFSGKGKSWVMAYKHYETKQKKKGKLGDNRYQQDKLKEKIRNFGYKAQELEEVNNLIAVLGFLTLIWPKDGETDTKFGKEEIKAMIIFKFFLMEESQKKMIDEFFMQ